MGWNRKEKRMQCSSFSQGQTAIDEDHPAPEPQKRCCCSNFEGSKPEVEVDAVFQLESEIDSNEAKS
jgi:hypothetical protein